MISFSASLAVSTKSSSGASSKGADSALEIHAYFFLGFAELLGV